MMNYESSECTISKTSKTCNICGKHVNNPRAVSWEYNTCPSCYGYETPVINNDTTVTVIVTPMTNYLDKYTPFEMRRMKEKIAAHEKAYKKNYGNFREDLQNKKEVIICQ